MQTFTQFNKSENIQKKRTFEGSEGDGGSHAGLGVPDGGLAAVSDGGLAAVPRRDGGHPAGHAVVGLVQLLLHRLADPHLGLAVHLRLPDPPRPLLAQLAHAEPDVVLCGCEKKNCHAKFVG